MDGLQEDLNRIHKKPYIEKPDSTDEMVHNPVALRQMAEKCWDIYKKRNDSVITDLFAGMYKSTVVCPVCDKVSIIFDPFNNLTLQLPIVHLFSKTIGVFPLHSRPINVAVDIDKNASIFALKEYICGKVGIDAKKTVLVEIWKNKFFKIFKEDNITIEEEAINENDMIYLYEIEDIPTNFPPPKKQVSSSKSYFSSHDEDDVPEGESPLAEKMLVPVFHRRPKQQKNQQKVLFGYPLFILLTPEEAKDYETIFRKILSQVENMTTRNFVREAQGGDLEVIDNGTEDSDTVVMHSHEADSSTDSRVQANSLESEDGMIDISMSDSEVAAPQKPILQPSSYIPLGVQGLFEMRYIPSNGTQMIFVGNTTSSIEETKPYDLLSSRKPDPWLFTPAPTARDLINQRLQKVDSPPSSDEEADGGWLPPQAGNSDEDSDGLPYVEQLCQYRNGGGLITYTRKVKQPSKRQCGGSSEIVPLIRLGESILLEWSTEGYEALFTGNAPDGNEEIRGTPTWDHIETLPDLELDEMRRRRSDKRRSGVSLDECLDEFGKPEVLSENDAWYCPRCKEHRRASKTFELWKAPDILVIHLKRFSAQRGLRDKLDIVVDFPIKGLDLSSRVAMQEEGKSPIYDLFAVDNHYGGLGGGHYTAYASNFMDENHNWYEYNGKSCYTTVEILQWVLILYRFIRIPPPRS